MDNSFLTKIKSKVESLEKMTKDKARFIKSSNPSVKVNSIAQTNENNDQTVKDLVTPIDQKESTDTEQKAEESVDLSSQTQNNGESSYEILTGEDGTILHYKVSKERRLKNRL